MREYVLYKCEVHLCGICSFILEEKTAKKHLTFPYDWYILPLNHTNELGNIGK